MTQTVVDVLEVVKVNKHHCEFLAITAAVRNGLAQAFLQQRAVREPGERIVECLVLELLFEFVTTGVVVTRDGKSGAGFILVARCGHFHKAFFVGIGDQAHLSARAACGLRVGERSFNECLILGVDEVHPAGAGQRVSGGADQPCHGWRDVGDA